MIKLVNFITQENWNEHGYNLFCPAFYIDTSYFCEGENSKRRVNEKAKGVQSQIE